MQSIIFCKFSNTERKEVLFNTQVSEKLGICSREVCKKVRQKRDPHDPHNKTRHNLTFLILKGGNQLPKIAELQSNHTPRKPPPTKHRNWSSKFEPNYHQRHWNPQNDGFPPHSNWNQIPKLIESQRIHGNPTERKRKFNASPRKRSNCREFTLNFFLRAEGDKTRNGSRFFDNVVMIEVWVELK